MPKSATPEMDDLRRGRTVFLRIEVLALLGAGLFTAWASTRTNLDAAIQAGVLVFMVAQAGILLVWHIVAPRRGWSLLSLQQFERLNAGVSGVFGVVFAIIFVFALGAYAADWLFPDQEWALQWRYSLESNLEGARYAVEKRPHTCEFLTAPVGSKHCHFERVVSTVRVKNGELVSWDEGKTWVRAAPDQKPSVNVTWTRVEE